MADIIMGCDRNKPSQDKKNMKTIAKLLEKAGHEVKILSVGPGNLQEEMRKKSSKGKVAVFLVNGADLQTYKDFYKGMAPKGYYHTKYCYFGCQGYLNKRTMTCQGTKTVKLKKAHDDDSSKSFTADIVGLTTAEVMEKYKSRISYACGSSVQELGNNLVQVIGGGTNTSGSSKESSGSSIKEALKKAVAPWDGDVEIRIVGDTVYVNKIPDPATATLEITEYDNAIYDSITVTDINKNTVNSLSLTYKNQILNIKDSTLIKRFGTISKKITAPKTVKSLSQAKTHLRREWNKIRREDGRSVECKVPGSTKWKSGRWVRVYLPSYFIDDYMYITKTSDSEDSNGDWTTNVTLVDYPPSFGLYEDETKSTSTSKTTKKDSKSKSSSKKSSTKKKKASS